ncbi:hypothetical protein ACN28S_62010 [Cystobacter fuscus]
MRCIWVQAGLLAVPRPSRPHGRGVLCSGDSASMWLPAKSTAPPETKRLPKKHASR